MKLQNALGQLFDLYQGSYEVYVDSFDDVYCEHKEGVKDYKDIFRFK